MSARHHPSDETILRGAAGRLGAGLRAVLAAHLDVCPQCRDRHADFQALGGVLLEAAPAGPVRPIALEKIFARIDAAETLRTPRLEAPEIEGIRLPAAFSGAKIGPWRFLHPKLRWANVALPGAGAEKLLLLKLAPGFSVPSHRHGGLELTHVLSGAFADCFGSYGPGDLIEHDDASAEHRPRAHDNAPCLCLIAVERPLRMSSLAARLVQPLLGL